MRTIVLKLFCWLCLTTIITTNVLAHSKTAYIESQWRHKLNTKDISNNRYASLLMGRSSGSSISGTTSKPSWYKYDNNNIKQPARSNNYNYNLNNNNNGVRLRHSKYPNLNNLMTRLNKMQPTTMPPTTSSPSPYQYRYNNQNAKSSDKLFYNNYNTDEVYDFDYEDEESAKDSEDLQPEYDKWEDEDEEEKDDQDLDDEDDLLDDEDEEEDGWQAEEATETSPSSLTDYKWQHYGTRSRVEETIRNQNYLEHSTIYSDTRAAMEHIKRMDKETRCREPSPRVLSIQSIHPDPGKSYMPHCTVLHRCAEDTGCCANHAMKCGPKRQTIIYLYFYTTTVGKPRNKVEKLPFYNHTECGCIDKSSEISILDPGTTEDNQEVSRSYRSSVQVRAADSSPETIRRCKCPEEYTPRLYRGSHCTCDCLAGNIDCEQMKLGKEFFSLKDRLCILNDQCGIPTCEYGSYMRNTGRCPRKQEKFEAFANASRDIH